MEKCYYLQTRWVAVYLEIHCNIGSKRAFSIGVFEGDTTVYLFTDAQALYFDDT